MQKEEIIKKKGHPEIKFHPGALHDQLGIPQDQKIPAPSMQAALSGKKGPLAEKRANFARNVLVGKKK